MRKFLLTKIKGIRGKIMILTLLGIVGLVFLFLFQFYVSATLKKSQDLYQATIKISAAFVELATIEDSFNRTNQKQHLGRIKELAKNLDSLLQTIVSYSQNHDITAKLNELSEQAQQNTSLFDESEKLTSQLFTNLVFLGELTKQFYSESQQIVEKIDREEATKRIEGAALAHHVSSLRSDLKQLSHIIDMQHSAGLDLILSGDLQYFEERGQFIKQNFEITTSNIETYINAVENQEYREFWKQKTIDLSSSLERFSLHQELWKKQKDLTDQLVAISKTALAKTDELQVFAAREAEAKNRFGTWISMLAVVATVIATGLFAMAVTRSVMSPLTRAVAALRNAINDVHHTSEAMQAATHTLDQAVTEQSASVQETSASITEMKSMLMQTVQQTSDSKSSAEKVNGKTEEGNQVIVELTTAMESVKEATDQLHEMAQIIKDIAAKTRIINDIVFKTQLLSFNASIEAARAGQHGRGFAVVAEEVGNLAQLSGNSAKEISALLEKSESKVQTIVKGTQEKIIASINVTGKVTQIFGDIAGANKQIFEKIQTVFHATQEQQGGIVQVGTSVGQISSAAESIQTETAGVSTLAVKLTKQGTTLRSTADDLEHLAFGSQQGQSGAEEVSGEEQDSSTVGEDLSDPVAPVATPNDLKKSA